MKYIIFDSGINITPVVFPQWISHQNIAFNNEFLGKPIAAGFCVISDGDVQCYGESSTLCLCSRPADAVLIGRLFNAVKA